MSRPLNRVPEWQWQAGHLPELLPAAHAGGERAKRRALPGALGAGGRGRVLGYGPTSESGSAVVTLAELMRATASS